jgi:NADPH:quinone reductase
MLFHFVAQRERLEAMTTALFDALFQGVLTAQPGKAFPIADAAAAHDELESRRAPGPLLLVP